MAEQNATAKKNATGGSKKTPSKTPSFDRRTPHKIHRNKTHVAKLDKPTKVQELHAGAFSIDDQVQRTLNEGRARKMSEDFQPHATGLLTASQRADGHIYLLDGMHRVVAARMCNYDGTLLTRVFYDLTLDEEAGLFLTLNTTRAPQPIDRFKVRITLGDPAAVGINKILKFYGLHVQWASSNAKATISAIGTLEKVYQGAGIRPPGGYLDLVDKTVRTLVEAYGREAERKAFSRTIIEGVGIFWATFGNRIDRERITLTLRNKTPHEIEAQTRTLRDAAGGTLGENAAIVLHRAYNKGYRHRLPQFHEIDVRNNYVPEDDPLYVDPNDFVREPELDLAAAT